MDTLVVAGGEDAEQACKDPFLVEWVRSMAPRVRRVASICTGAFILAAAGLLNHRRVTTHWMYSECLATAYPSIKVDSNLIFARDGNIYSSGGITAGIDLAMALVEEDLGREIPLAIARMMVVFPRRPGGQSQFSAYMNLLEEGKSRPDIGELQAWILGHPGENLSVSALANRMAMSPRNFARLSKQRNGRHAGAVCRTGTGRCSPPQTRKNRPAGRDDRPGMRFRQSRTHRRTFQRHFAVSPQDYRARFRSTLLT